MKITLNRTCGGFGISEAALALVRQSEPTLTRADFMIPTVEARKLLVPVVEKLGTKEASAEFSWLEIAEVPEDESWFITEYDGYESVMTRELFEQKCQAFHHPVIG